MKNKISSFAFFAMCFSIILWQFVGYNTIDSRWAGAEGWVRSDYKLYWTGIVFFIYAPLCLVVFAYLTTDRRMRAFTLKGVDLHSLGGMGRHTERFLFDKITWNIPIGLRTFFIDLENTTETVNCKWGCDTQTVPVLHYDVKEASMASYNDFIRVHIDEEGLVSFRYLGTDLSNPSVDVSWELSEPFTVKRNSVKTIKPEIPND